MFYRTVCYCYYNTLNRGDINIRNSVTCTCYALSCLFTMVKVIIISYKNIASDHTRLFLSLPGLDKISMSFFMYLGTLGGVQQLTQNFSHQTYTECTKSSHLSTSVFLCQLTLRFVVFLRFDLLALARYYENRVELQLVSASGPVAS